MRNIFNIIVLVALLPLIVSCDYIGKLKKNATTSKVQTTANSPKNGNDSIGITKLPKISKDYIEKYLPDKEIARVIAADDEFKVWLSTGEQLEFDLDGGIQEIECAAGIPESVIDERVLQDVRLIDSHAPIVKIEKKSNGDYEVKLNNGMEIEYDASYKRMGIDD
ncbi:MAG: PepSY-like domain-containing protein [Muribaculaceae bacterium]|nr:PepSY-like domain-containing protein [Muribaculaceae bacterium]